MGVAETSSSEGHELAGRSATGTTPATVDDELRQAARPIAQGLRTRQRVGPHVAPAPLQRCDGPTLVLASENRASDGCDGVNLSVTPVELRFFGAWRRDVGLLVTPHVGECVEPSLCGFVSSGECGVEYRLHVRAGHGVGAELCTIVIRRGLIRQGGRRSCVRSSGLRTVARRLLGRSIAEPRPVVHPSLGVVCGTGCTSRTGAAGWMLTCIRSTRLARSYGPALYARARRTVAHCAQAELRRRRARRSFRS